VLLKFSPSLVGETSSFPMKVSGRNEFLKKPQNLQRPSLL